MSTFAIAGFLDEGAEVHLPDGRSALSSTVARMAAALSVSAPLIFMAPGGAVESSPTQAIEAPADAEPAKGPAPDVPEPEHYEYLASTPAPAAEPVPVAAAAAEEPVRLASFAGPQVTTSGTLGGQPSVLPRFTVASSGVEPGLAAPRIPEAALDFDGIYVSSGVAAAILDAARLTGTDPALMMAMADKESSFQPKAKTKTTSAVGLYQFLEQTWFEVVRGYGPQHGLGDEAASIRRAGKKWVVDDPEERSRILALREDPKLSALMAGEMTRSNLTTLKSEFGKLTPQQAYVAHFLGLGGAQKLLRAVAKDPSRIGSDVFPEAAKKNPGIFKGGVTKRDLTVGEVSQRLGKVIGSRITRYDRVEAKLEAVAPSREKDGMMLSLSFRR